MTGMYEKVLDWVNDFDHADPEYNERAHQIWEEFQGCLLYTSPSPRDA